MAVHSLLFMVRPDPAAAAAAAALREHLRSELAPGTIRGVMSEERLHVTLHHLGKYDRLPTALVQAAERAGGRIEMPPFGVRFDRINEQGALQPTVRLRALHDLQRTLGDAMRAEGIGAHARPARSFSPHISLWYRGKQIDGQPVDPVRWTVDEFLLIDSLVGQSTHVVIRRWPLQVRQLALGDW